MKMQSLSPKEKQKYDTVFKKELNKLKKKTSIRSVLIGGSYARDELSKGSDLDFILIVKNGHAPKENRKEVDGIAVEYFSITEEVAKATIRQEQSTPNRFITGVIEGCVYLEGEQEVANTIISLAKKSLATKVPALSREEKTAFYFFLNGSPLQEKRIGQRGQKLAQHLRMNHKLYTCFELAHRFEQVPIPSYKKWDDKLSYLQDRKMANLLSKTVLASTNSEYWKEWSKLVKYTSGLLASGREHPLH